MQFRSLHIIMPMAGEGSRCLKEEQLQEIKEEPITNDLPF
jgi:hypothetical protein